MPSIYLSYKIEPGDSLDTERKKLYLGMISLGEQLYSFNAALVELRKEFTALDEKFKTLNSNYSQIRKQS